MLGLSIAGQSISDPSIVAVLESIKNMLYGFGADQLYDVSIGTILVGIVHKFLKIFVKEGE